MMDKHAFRELTETSLCLIEKTIDQLLPLQNHPYDKVIEAMRYAVLGGGKRIRGMYVLQIGRLLGVPDEELLQFAAALEMIHAYSLVHDDLPAMDNDDMRRGKPSCHKAFGEGMAVLAGDALLNSAMEILLKQCLKGENARKAAYYMASCSGVHGMIGGQCIDLEAAGGSHEMQELLPVLQDLKTAALLRASMVCPALLAGAEESVIKLFEELGTLTGLSFQLRDDLLDVEAAPELGKTGGKDARDHKLTYVTVFGEDKTRAILLEQDRRIEALFSELEQLGVNTEWLQKMQEFLLTRKM